MSGRREIYITKFDKQRLDELIEVAENFGDHRRHDLHDLQEELDRARIVPSTEVPHHVVTMNSKVSIRDVDSNEERIFTLVFPKDANIDKGSISVLAPVGTAILGYSEGDIVEWTVPSGLKKILIVKILYQPEAAGDYHL